MNIIKYNKRIIGKLDINKEDFETYITLKEFNNKYNTNIDDIDTKELNLSERYIGNRGLKDLFEFHFNKLEELYLSLNKISDINILEKVNFAKLEKLYLSDNNISNIDVLGKVNFKELKALDFCNNKISDIKVLEKVIFKKLEKLNLGEN